MGGLHFIAPEREGEMTFRHSWSLCATGAENNAIPYFRVDTLFAVPFHPEKLNMLPRLGGAPSWPKKAWHLFFFDYPVPLITV